MGFFEKNVLFVEDLLIGVIPLSRKVFNPHKSVFKNDSNYKLEINLNICTVH